MIRYFKTNVMIKKILKFVRLVPLTFPLVSWFKTAHTSQCIMVGYTPHVPVPVRDRDGADVGVWALTEGNDDICLL
jgi:hypothetical protein